jgi:hypothetical protein
MSLPQAQVLRGPGSQPARQCDLTNQALLRLGAIVDGTLLADATINVPPSLPAEVTVSNPLGRVATGAFPVKQNQALSIQFKSSTVDKLTLLVMLVPTAVNGVITGLSGLKGNVTSSLWVF